MDTKDQSGRRTRVASRGAALGCALLISACSDCGRDEEAPVVPETAGETQFAPIGAAEGSAEAPVERPVIVHEEPPTAADFAVPPVTGDWTTWRGNQARSGLRNARAISEPEIAWSIQVGVNGYSSTPLVTDDAVYVSTQGDQWQRADARDGVYRINPENGAIVWHRATPHDANGLTLVGDVLVVGSDSRQVFGFRAEDGEPLWTVDQDCQIYHAPAARDGRLYLIRNEEVGAVEIVASSGAVQGAVDCVRSERGAVSVDDERVYRAAVRSMSAWDADGRIWRDEPVVGEREARGRWNPPQLTENMVISGVHRWPFGTESALTHRPAIVARWQDNGQIAWVVDVNDPATANPEPPGRDTAFLRSAPWSDGRRIYWTPTHAGHLAAWDLVTGEAAGTVDFPDCRSRAFGSIVGTPEMGYFPRHDGVLYAFTTEPLAIAWTLALGVHGAIGTEGSHIPVQGACSAFPKDGTALFSAPAIGSDGTLYVGTGDGWLYAIRDAGWE